LFQVLRLLLQAPLKGSGLISNPLFQSRDSHIHFCTLGIKGLLLQFKILVDEDGVGFKGFVVNFKVLGDKG
jgi:hypothetical protein